MKLELKTSKEKGSCHSLNPLQICGPMANAVEKTVQIFILRPVPCNISFSAGCRSRRKDFPEMLTERKRQWALFLNNT
jgi:hypothetical protein